MIIRHQRLQDAKHACYDRLHPKPWIDTSPGARTLYDAVCVLNQLPATHHVQVRYRRSGSACMEQLDLLASTSAEAVREVERWLKRTVADPVHTVIVTSAEAPRARQS